jgi:acyl-CoA dehydrogenase
MPDTVRNNLNDVAAFREQVRQFVAASLPDDMAKRGRWAVHFSREDYLAWARILAHQGWSVPGWPAAHGGPGWSARQRQIFEEEALIAGAPPLHIQTVDLAGPLIISFGNAAQQAEHLPAIRQGQRIWAQGFSEPGSGSDLANLRTRAARDGDAYVVNGQKIWTSEAFMADDIFCLVRTDPSVKPQLGLSMLLFPLSLPGVTVRPIRQIDGGASLCEVFFEDVRVPANCLLGVEGQGWTYAKALLAGERTKTAEVPRNKKELARLKIILSQTSYGGRPRLEDRETRRRLAMLEADLIAVETGVEGELDRAEESSLPIPSVLKLQGTALMQSILEFSREALGPYGALDYGFVLEDTDRPFPGPATAPGVTAEFLFRRAATIYGGSSQIQRNIIAKTLRDLDPSTARISADEDLSVFAGSVAKFLERDYTFSARRAWLKEPLASRLNWAAMAGQGWVAATAPVSAGGMDLGPAYGAVLFEQFGRGLVLEPMLPALLGLRLIVKADPLRAGAIGPGVVDGRLIAVAAHEEADSAGQLSRVSTVASRVGGEFRLTGRKVMVPGAPQADYFIISARTSQGLADPDGISLFLVHRETPGLILIPGRMIDGRSTGDIELRDVAIAADCLLGEAGGGFGPLRAARDLALLDIAAETVGAMDGAFWTTRDYLRTRQQFGQPLYEFQALQHILADMFVELCRARALLQRTAEAAESGCGGDFEHLAAAARARIARSAFELAGSALQLHGGIGLTEEYIIGHYFKRICALNSLLGGAVAELDRLAGIVCATPPGDAAS